MIKRVFSIVLYFKFVILTLAARLAFTKQGRRLPGNSCAINVMDILVYIFLTIHIVLSCIGTIKIKNTIYLNNRRKIINLICLWLIPFLWFLILTIMLKRTPGSYEMEIKNDVSSNNFYESGKGNPFLPRN